MTQVIGQETGSNWHMIHGDACEVIQGIPDNSVDFTIHSPPFANLYVYSDSESDMGNCKTTAEFIEHYKFLIPEMLRITVPGRLCAIHVKDLPRYKKRDGASALERFPDKCADAFEECGWDFHSRVTIWKCPVFEREKSNPHGLLHSNLMKDSSAARQGCADYLLVFRKNPGPDTLMSEKPIERPGGLTEYIGDPAFHPFRDYTHPSPLARTGKPDSRMIDGSDIDGKPAFELDSYQSSICIWRRYAEPVWWDLPGVDLQVQRAIIALTIAGWVPAEINSVLGVSGTDAVWFDIDPKDVLNYKIATSEQDEAHICPLQLGLIKRAIHLWSNPGDVVFTPFGGVGSELVSALRLGRKALGIELKREYFNTACRHCRIEESHIDAPRLDLEAAMAELPSCDDEGELGELADIGFES